VAAAAWGPTISQRSHAGSRRITLRRAESLDGRRASHGQAWSRPHYRERFDVPPRLAAARSAGSDFVVAATAAQPPVYTPAPGEAAVSGYDPVAYFTDGKPVEGRPDLTYQWEGGTWRFATPAHLEQFKADPAKYAPQFGGYYAWAVSQGYSAPADPQAWKIVDDRLYLNYNLDVKKTWEQDVPGNIAKGEGNWPAVLAK
jgi:YHS domain-containing protein